MESHDGCQIITLQFGHYSNHVGSHFWNIQSESLLGIVPSKDEDPGDAGEAPQVLFRDRKASAESCRRLRPRMVCVDLKGERGPQNLTTEDGTWSTAGAAQEQQGPSGSLMWDGAVMEVDSSSGPRSKCSWSSYLSKSVDLDPWSHVVLEDYRLAGCDPFDVFGMGLHLKLSALDEIEDAIRRHAEDCDNLRGFHVLSDADTGFGGLTVRVAEAILADQYPSKAGLHFPTFAPFAYPKAMVHEELEEAGSQLPVRPHLDRFLNTVLTLSALVSPSSAASIVTPLSLVNTYLPLSKYPEHSEDMTSWLHSRKFKHIQYCQHLSYQTSAVLASALDTATLPWRLKASTAKLWNICGALASPGGRKLAGMALAAPIPSSIDGRDLSFAESVGAAMDGNYLTSLTPDSDLPSLRNRQVFPQIISIRSSGPFGRSGVEGQLTRLVILTFENIFNCGRPWLKPPAVSLSVF